MASSLTPSSSFALPSVAVQYNDEIKSVYLPAYANADTLYQIVSAMFELTDRRFTLRVNHQTLRCGTPWFALPWEDLLRGGGSGSGDGSGHGSGMVVVHEWKPGDCDPSLGPRVMTVMLGGMDFPVPRQIPISPVETVTDLAHMASKIWLCDPKHAILMHCNKQLAPYTTIKDIRLGPQPTLILHAPVGKEAIDLVVIVPGRLLHHGVYKRQRRHTIRVLRSIGAANLRRMLSTLLSMEESRMLFAIYKTTLIKDEDLTKFLTVVPHAMVYLYIRTKPKSLPRGHFLLFISFAVHGHTIVSHIHETVADVIHTFSVHCGRLISSDPKEEATTNHHRHQLVLLEGTRRLDPTEKIVGYSGSRNLRIKLVKSNTEGNATPVDNTTAATAATTSHEISNQASHAPSSSSVITDASERTDEVLDRNL